jgi:hypothetical protein
MSKESEHFICFVIEGSEAGCSLGLFSILVALLIVSQLMRYFLNHPGDSFYTWFCLQANIFAKDYGQTVLKMKYGTHHVCRPCCVEFWPFMLTQFNAAVLTFCDCFRQVGLRPHSC